MQTTPLDLYNGALTWDGETKRYILVRAKNKSNRLCQTVRCRNDPKDGNRSCNKCISRIYRANNPEMSKFHDLKNRAKQRKKEFTITFDYFVAWLRENNYMELKGKSSESLSIDRIDDSLGYVPGNLRVLTLAENSYKEQYRRQFVPEQETFSFEIDEPF